MVFSSFPIPTDGLTESTSIAIAESIQWVQVQTSLMEDAIATAYVCQGQGQPPILLLHGFDSSVMEFRRLLPKLAEQTQSWAVDLLGFGFTD
jgi:hypothetical protein